MILVPLNTDAPLYHRPIGTLAMIGLNTLVYIVTFNDLGSAVENWGLQHGVGLTPLQWLTSNFIHFGFLHLALNMIFLWGFGLVVEGKIGNLPFLGVYLGIGIIQCLTEQIMLFRGEGVSFGASSIIYGLMVMALIWAPRNEMTIFYWIFFIIYGVSEITIMTFALIYLTLSGIGVALTLYLGGSLLSSDVLHLMGAIVGGMAGTVAIQWKLVDCEGWDLFTWLRGGPPLARTVMSEGFQADQRRREATRKATRKSRSRSDFAVPEDASPERFTEYLIAKKPVAALAELQRLRHRDADWLPPAKQLLALARGLRTSNQMQDAAEIYKQFLEMAPGETIACLELAEILIFVQERPTAAQRFLQRCEVSTFSDKQQQRHQQALAHAQAMIDDGVLEIEFE